MTISVRSIQAGDEARWQELWQAYLAFYEQELPADVTADVWRRLMDEGEVLQGFVAEDEGQVIGFTHCFLHGSTWTKTGYVYLEDLFVDQTIRSKGAGRALIMAVKDYAQEIGASKVYWHTNESNKTAQALYHKVAELSDYLKFDMKVG